MGLKPNQSEIGRAICVKPRNSESRIWVKCGMGGVKFDLVLPLGVFVPVNSSRFAAKNAKADQHCHQSQYSLSNPLWNHYWLIPFSRHCDGRFDVGCHELKMQKTETETFCPASRSEWRQWLQARLAIR